ncbi:CoA-binding protein [Candidatus Dojkabacteria bacterium]|nr:CoA-binding protein [Candidatus Dojkabacteria bacterium]
MTARNSNITSLLSPSSVAITGATSNPEDLGSYILRNIILGGYKGRVFPVNEKLSQLYDFDTYSSIKNIKEEVDLAIIATPSDRVIDDVYDCTRAKVNNICIVSKGFAETGVNGLTLQRKITKMANEAGIRVLGPNSLGLISTSKLLNATFSPDMPKEGKAVFISQSGALINALLEYSQFYSLGFSEILGFGNKSDVNEINILDYYSSLRKDGQPTVLGCYLENITDGKEFLESAQKFTKTVPLVALIPSESPKTREYIYAHSGTVLQKDAVIDLALSQSGAIKVYTQQELYDLLLGFSWQVLPRGGNVAIVSNAGGGLILAIEQLYRKGLRLVNFSTDVKRMLISELDWKGQSRGVVDLGGQALSLNYLKALDIVLGDPDVNSVVVILSPQVMTQIEESAEVIGRLAREHGKTIIAAFMGYEGVEKGIKALSKYFIPAFNSVDRAIFTLAKMYEYFTWIKFGSQVSSRYAYQRILDKTRSIKILELIEKARVDKQMGLRVDQCFDILRYYGMDTSNMRLLKSLTDALDFAEEQEYPVEFLCLTNGIGKVTYKKDQLKRAYEDHFLKLEEGEGHRFTDHIVKKLYRGRRKFKITILKDTYYEHREKGFSIKDLDKLSFGYFFEFQVEGLKITDAIRRLLPITREQFEKDLESFPYAKYFGYRPGLKSEKFTQDLLAFVQKITKIPQDFPQILELDVACVVDRGKILIVDCEMKLDLVVSYEVKGISTLAR